MGETRQPRSKHLVKLSWATAGALKPGGVSRQAASPCELVVGCGRDKSCVTQKLPDGGGYSGRGCCVCVGALPTSEPANRLVS